MGLSSAVAVTMLAGGVGVAGAATTASRPVRTSAAPAWGAGTIAPPPMSPGGPRGIGGGVKVGRFAQGTVDSSPKTNHAATVGMVPRAMGIATPWNRGPELQSGLSGGGPSARGPPLTEYEFGMNSKGTQTS